jgi:glutaredoxin
MSGAVSGARQGGEAARVVLYGKPGCHLCDDARAVVARVTGELDERFVEHDITGDRELMRAHGESIPVLVVDGVVVDFWRVSEARLRAALGRRGV